jgi:hypothetical protein
MLRACIALLALAACRTAAGAPRADPSTLTVGGGRIEVAFAAGPLDVSRRDLMAWIAGAADAVTAYYGRFPVARYRIVVEPVAGEAGVLAGTTWAYGGAHSRVRVGEHTTVAQLDRDWVMTHEMVHTAFPDQERSHHWIEEGIATYVEPLARSWVGRYPAARVWADLTTGLPKGLPEPGDRGLDHTPTWGRTYWGGALFCLIADVGIRERTAGKRGLIDALRGILAAGGNSQVDWPIERALRAGDQAVGVPVLEELYAQMKDAPVAPDLGALWRSLGVVVQRGQGVQRGQIELDDRAPRAALRQAISARPAPPGASP